MSNDIIGRQFDGLVGDYAEITAKQHAFFDANTSYMQQYKIALAKQLVPSPNTILDYGCGIGLLQRFIPDYFPDALVRATDVSEESLAQVRLHYPAVHVVSCPEAMLARHDLIMVSCVMHHVLIDDRRQLVSDLLSALNPGGSLLFFEHNPWNPVTRLMVSTCPIDEGAILMRRAELRKLVGSSSSDVELRSGYTLFFPGFLKSLRPLEDKLQWLPLGGQYFVLATRKK